MGCEAQVRSLPRPDRQRVDTSDDYPLANVELLAKNDQWPLDVLLDDPDGQATDSNALHHLVEVRVDLDSAAT